MTSHASPAPLAPAGNTNRLRRRLLAWYVVEARDLPWRATRDPWAILVSEIMLQQTQAARVAPAFVAFLAAFPTPRALASASPADVLNHWRGLGYNRRALNLQRAATAIVGSHAGMVPEELAELKALPGLGDYTARAVQAFAFEADAAPVDTNVARVLARAVAGGPQTRREAQQLADALVPQGAAAVWSQALMDLGARYCVAATPRCGPCPVAAECRWRNGGNRAPDPAAGTTIRARPQGKFVGSTRYHRGRLVDALRGGPVPGPQLPGAAHLEDRSRLERIVAGLVSDGLAEWNGDCLRLPNGPPGPRARQPGVQD